MDRLNEGKRIGKHPLRNEASLFFIIGFMNNLDFNLSSPDISPALKLHRFIPSSFAGFRLRSTCGFWLGITGRS
ncbi:Capsid [Gossypium arboreum]|uniref:Capsid n=1 Tax=Gossypium arboreum TaxID=29729 RepID=A0A0B0P5N4_GOSAR|nr:Capsid [Gossypium arboreum]